MGSELHGEPPSIEELVERAQARKLSRRQLITILTGAGVTAGAAATIAAIESRRSSLTTSQQQHLQQHDQHVTTQVQGDVGAHMADYAPDAIVDDPLFADPFVGKQAITERFVAEVASVPDRALRIISRTVVNGQLIVEWQATGTHMASFLGFGGTGRRYTLRGVTVVTRSAGKIVRESHYYNVANLRRQVEG